MTKAKAIELMIYHSRAILEPSFARKLAKAFGYTLKDINVKPIPMENHYRANYNEQEAKLKGVGVCNLSEAIAYKKFNIEQYGSESK